MARYDTYTPLDADRIIARAQAERARVLGRLARHLAQGVGRLIAAPVRGWPKRPDGAAAAAPVAGRLDAHLAQDIGLDPASASSRRLLGLSSSEEPRGLMGRQTPLGVPGPRNLPGTA